MREGSAPLGVCWDRVDFEGLTHRPHRRDRLLPRAAARAGRAVSYRVVVSNFCFRQLDALQPASQRLVSYLQARAERAGAAP